MKNSMLKRLALAAAVAAPILVSGAANAALKFPSLDYRTGPYAPNGIPFANGYSDYFTLINERDGGINGEMIDNPSCETAYNTQQGVECYEKLKENALVFQPLSTGITYQLIPRTAVDKVPVHSMGYGRTSASNGKVFPYVFNFPATYWSQATVLVQYIGDKSGGMDKLKGQKIYLVYHNSAYGKEPIRTLESMAAKYGFEFRALAVDHPGQEQKATWLQIRREKPDWVLMWGWGVMNQVAIQEAASIRYPMDRFIGVWWSGSENDVLPAGDAANGYLSGAFHAPGDGFKVHDDIKKFVYDKGKGKGERERVGEVLYNRGMVAAMWAVEAARTAMKIHNTTKLTGEMMRDGYENLNVDEKRLEELGMKDFTYAVKITCENHESSGKVAVQQWDAKAKKWSIVSKFYDPLRDITGPLVEEDSAAFAKENNITPRDCK